MIKKIDLISKMMFIRSIEQSTRTVITVLSELKTIVFYDMYVMFVIIS